jgi:hypothetical protein
MVETLAARFHAQHIAGGGIEEVDRTAHEHLAVSEQLVRGYRGQFYIWTCRM